MSVKGASHRARAALALVLLAATVGPDLPAPTRNDEIFEPRGGRADTRPDDPGVVDPRRTSGRLDEDPNLKPDEVPAPTGGAPGVVPVAAGAPSAPSTDGSRTPGELPAGRGGGDLPPPAGPPTVLSPGAPRGSAPPPAVTEQQFGEAFRDRENKLREARGEDSEPPKHGVTADAAVAPPAAVDPVRPAAAEGTAAARAGGRPGEPDAARASAQVKALSEAERLVDIGAPIDRETAQGALENLRKAFPEARGILDAIADKLRDPASASPEPAAGGTVTTAPAGGGRSSTAAYGLDGPVPAGGVAASVAGAIKTGAGASAADEGTLVSGGEPSPLAVTAALDAQKVSPPTVRTSSLWARLVASARKLARLLKPAAKAGRKLASPKARGGSALAGRFQRPSRLGTILPDLFLERAGVSVMDEAGDEEDRLSAIGWVFLGLVAALLATSGALVWIAVGRWRRRKARA